MYNVLLYHRKQRAGIEIVKSLLCDAHKSLEYDIAHIKINNQHISFNTISSKISHLMNSNISSLFSKWFEPKLDCVVNCEMELPRKRLKSAEDFAWCESTSHSMTSFLKFVYFQVIVYNFSHLEDDSSTTNDKTFLIPM